MRAFIAIALPKDIKDYLAGLQEQLKTSQADVKWVTLENIHLTLKFLGEIDEKKLDKVREIIEAITKDKHSFYIHLSGLGAFPKLNFPRVIWIGMDKGDSQSKEIAQALEDRLFQIGVHSESRPFSSHITLGRVRSSLNRQKLVEILQRLQQNDLGKETREFLVSQITLFKSTLTPKGPIYEALKETNLKTI